MFHEQSRLDRDKYVQINWENIVDPNRNNVNFQTADIQIETDYLGVPYDINSIMHYQPTVKTIHIFGDYYKIIIKKQCFI